MNSPLLTGPYISSLDALPMGELPSSLRSFVQQPLSYREQYLQSQYGVAFDGYSYDGQTDSINQGPEDPLHSFVLSDFSKPEHFPQQFSHFLNDQWHPIKQFVSTIEQQLLAQIDDRLLQQYNQNFGHMLSANYYPDQVTRKADRPDLRLTEHPDVSLITVFVFGNDSCFEYQHPVTQQWHSLEQTGRVVAFAGHLLEWLTDGAINALNHRVRYHNDEGERFSFALFSLPYPHTQLTSLKGNRLTTEAFYQEHLSLWD